MPVVLQLMEKHIAYRFHGCGMKQLKKRILNIADFKMQSKWQSVKGKCIFAFIIVIFLVLYGRNFKGRTEPEAGSAIGKTLVAIAKPGIKFFQVFIPCPFIQCLKIKQPAQSRWKYYGS